MEQLHSSLRESLTVLATQISLGVSTVLAWAYTVSVLLPSCPVQEGGITIRLLSLPLGLYGVIAWGVLLVAASWRAKEQRTWLALAVSAACCASVLIGEPAPQAVVSALVLLLLSWENAKACLEGVALGVVAVEALSLTYLLLRAFSVKVPFPPVLPLHFSLYCAFTPLTPLIVLAPLLSLFAATPLSRRTDSEDRAEGLGALAIGLALCLLVWAVLYSSELNRSSKLIGVDSVTRYYPHVLQLLAKGLPGVLEIGYDRPLYYLFLYVLAKTLGPIEAVKVLPLTSLAFYVVASYLSAKHLVSRRAAALAALAAPLTYTTTAGLYGGLFSNWTALSAALLTVTSLSLWLRRGRLTWLALYLAMLTVTVALHIYMGAVLFASTIASTLLLVLGKRYRRRAFTLLVLQTAVAALSFCLADNLAGQLGFRPPSRVVSSMALSWWRRALELQPFSTHWWEDFCYAVYKYAATAALDPTVWVFTSLGIATTGPSELSYTLLSPWLAVTYLLSFTAPFELIYRAIYDFPFSVGEAIGLAHFYSFMAERIGRRGAISWLAAVLSIKTTYTLAFAVGLAA